MTTKEIYDLSIELGMKADLRGMTKVKKYLKRIEDNYKKLDAEAKKDFDKEKMVNPYADTRLLVDNKKKQIKKVLTGIDFDTGEVLLADRLGGVDLIISHHPAGKALNDLHSVMDMQIEIYAGWGIPINVVDFMARDRQGEVSRRFMPINSTRAVDTARLLGIDMICTHTVCDNLAAEFVQKHLDKKKPEYLSDVLSAIKEIPEYSEAGKINDGPAIVVGHKDNHAGKIVVSEFTGGTNFKKEIYESMVHAGIGTVISMHMGEDHMKEAEKYHINVIIAGHMASDSLGMNLFLDKIEKKGVEVVPCSGLIRVKR